MKLTSPMADYPHIRQAGETFYLAGQGCRDPQSDSYAGTVIEANKIVSYNIAEQTKGVFANIERALQSVGLQRTDLVDIQVFLTTMDDFPGMNSVWNEFFAECQSPSRTTVAVRELPGHNKVEMKAIAYRKGHP